ncbi:MAG TPA: hypothetical protein VM261_26630 [Kofleriaceae bacterium]|nr:hypothetical protein [Kofleriaceae bacterium]
MRAHPILVATFVLGACKFAELPPVDEDGASSDATGNGDGGDLDADNTDARPPKVTAVAVGVDYAGAAVMGAIDVASKTLTPSLGTGQLATDPIVRFLGDEVWVINRLTGGNVVAFDPDDWTVTFSGGTGAGTNPQDVAVVGNKLFVPALATSGVRVLDRLVPGTIRSIDLSALDPDLQPDCVSAFAVGNTVVVTCGMLDGFTPRGNGMVVYIDAATETVTAMRALPVPNPLGQLRATPSGPPLAGDLLTAAPDFGAAPNDGCIVRIPTTPGAPSCVVTNTVLGGNPDVMAPSANGATIWLTVNGRMRGYDVLGATLAAPVGATNLVSLDACPDDTIIVGERPTTGGGVRLYRSDIEQTTAPLMLGKQPGYGNTISCFRR